MKFFLEEKFDRNQLVENEEMFNQSLSLIGANRRSSKNQILTIKENLNITYNFNDANGRFCEFFTAFNFIENYKREKQEWTD